MIQTEPINHLGTGQVRTGEELPVLSTLKYSFVVLVFEYLRVALNVAVDTRVL